MPQVEHHPKQGKEEDPMAIKRFRAHPDVKRAKAVFRDRVAKGMSMSEAQGYYDKAVLHVRKHLGFE